MVLLGIGLIAMGAGIDQPANENNANQPTVIATPNQVIILSQDNPGTVLPPQIDPQASPTAALESSTPSLMPATSTPPVTSTPKGVPTDGFLAGKVWSEVVEIGGQDGFDRHRAQPDLATDNTGRVYIVYQAIGTHILLTWSDDQGETWSTPVQVVDGAIPALLTSHDKIFLFYLTTTDNNETPTDLVVQVSLDRGVTWSQPYQVNEQPHTVYDNHYLAVIADNDGTLYAMWVSLTGIHFSRSDDEGRSWLDGQIFRPGGNRPHMALQANGELYVTWAQTNQNLSEVYVAHSANRGESWSSPQEVNSEEGYAYPFGIAFNHADQAQILWLKQVEREAYPFISWNQDQDVNWIAAPLTPDETKALAAWAELGADSAGHTYVAWLDGLNAGLYLSRSIDGLTWSIPEKFYTPAKGMGFNLVNGLDMVLGNDGTAYLTWTEAEPKKSAVYFISSQPQPITDEDRGNILGGKDLPISTPTPEAGSGPGGALGTSPSPTPLPPLPPTHCPSEGVQITYPKAGTVFTDLDVFIIGTANIPSFHHWKVEYATTPDVWNYLFEYNYPVNEDKLIKLNTSTVPTGLYGVRLTVVDETGNYPEPCEIWFINGYPH